MWWRIALRLLKGRWLPKAPVLVHVSVGGGSGHGNLAAAINAERAKHNLPSLEGDACLAEQAEHHRQTMMGLNHNGFTLRLVACSKQSGAENVAKGQQTAEQCVADWMTSSGHRRNLLGDWTVLGCAAGDRKWVAIFA